MTTAIAPEFPRTLAEKPKFRIEKAPAPVTVPPTEPPLEPLRSIHTLNFPILLNELGVSLLVTTYQAGKLVVVPHDGENLNTHFRPFKKPMGMALRHNRLALGTHVQLWEFHNIPAVAAKLEPQGKHDACFLPRRSHITGDIDIHEMAWGFSPSGETEELWFINTLFSCLCTLDPSSSFVPRWRPPFVTALAPQDRCHLNGLALVAGKPRYISALGMTDTHQGWRANKAAGGVLMDLDSGGKPIVTGLSMPHSPRWYRNQLWLLESGDGSIGTVDTQAGKYHKLTKMPGFARGLDFAGPLAFIGLSQVRESTVFSGIPITQRLNERTCGVWVVNIETGQVIAFLKFQDAVQEIFAVQVVPNRFPDLINDSSKTLASSYILPDEALKDVPMRLKTA